MHPIPERIHAGERHKLRCRGGPYAHVRYAKLQRRLFLIPITDQNLNTIAREDKMARIQP